MDKHTLESQLKYALETSKNLASVLDSNFGTDYLSKLDLDIAGDAPSPEILIDMSTGLATIAAVERVRAEAAKGGPDDVAFARDLETKFYIGDAALMMSDPALKFRIESNCSNARFRLAMTGGGDFALRSKWAAYPLERDPEGMRLWKLGSEDTPIPGAAALAGDLVTNTGKVLWRGLHLSDMEAWARQQWKEYLDILAARRGNAGLD